MRVKLEQSLLKTALRRSALGGAHNPLLGYVRARALKGKGSEPDALVLSSTNGVIEIELSVACVVEKEGDFIGHCRSLTGGVNSMPSGSVTLGIDKGRSGAADRISVVGSSGRRWTLSSVTMELPGLHEPSGDQIVVDTDTLRRLIHSVQFGTTLAASAYPERDGILIEAAEQAISAATFQGHLLLSATLERKEASWGAWRALIPSALLPAISDMLEEANQEKATTLSLFCDKTRVYLTGPSTLLSMTLPLGDFPPWRPYMDGIRNPPIAKLPRLALIASLKALELAVDAKDPATVIVIGKDQVHLTSRGENTHFVDSVPLIESHVTTADITIFANVGYLVGVLNSLDEDPEVTIDDSGQSLVVKTTTGSRHALSLMDLSKAPTQ